MFWFFWLKLCTEMDSFVYVMFYSYKSKFAFSSCEVFIHQGVPAVQELMHSSVSCSIDHI